MAKDITYVMKRWYILVKWGLILLYLIAVARKGPLEGLNAPAFELGKVQKWCWYCFVQIRRYWIELIEEIKITQCNLQNFEMFCCHSNDILIYIVKKIDAFSFQKCFICEYFKNM